MAPGLPEPSGRRPGSPGAARVAAGRRPALRDDDEPMLAELVEAGWQDLRRARRRAQRRNARRHAARRRRSGPSRRRACPPIASSGSAYSARTGSVAQARAATRSWDSRWSGSLAEDLRAFRDDLDVADPEGGDEVAQHVGLLPHRVDEQPPLLGARQGEHEARHAAARSEVDAAAAMLQAVDQRQGRQRVEQVEARDRGRAR